MIQCDTTLSDLPVVLIVEDEPLVRLLATEVLADAGIRTIEPCNADEALTLLEAKPDMAALVTDVKMPGSMDGFSLSRLAAMRWPHLGIVVSSAGSRPGEGDLPEARNSCRSLISCRRSSRPFDRSWAVASQL